jgi:hypothetical protein
MAETYGWTRLTQGAGFLEADLALESFPWVKPVQSGFRAVWSLQGVVEGRLGDPMSGPVTLIEEGRHSISPGETGRVAFHPLNVDRWRGVAPGTQLVLRARGGRELGRATISRVVGDPL